MSLGWVGMWAEPDIKYKVRHRSDWAEMEACMLGKDFDSLDRWIEQAWIIGDLPSNNAPKV